MPVTVTFDLEDSCNSAAQEERLEEGRALLQEAAQAPVLPRIGSA